MTVKTNSGPTPYAARVLWWREWVFDLGSPLWAVVVVGICYVLVLAS